MREFSLLDKQELEILRAEILKRNLENDINSEEKLLLIISFYTLKEVKWEFLNMIINNNYEHLYIYHFLISLFNKQNEYFLISAEKCIKITPDFSPIYYLRAKYYLQNYQFEEAANDIEKSYNLGLKYPLILKNLANAAFYAGNYDKSIKTYNKIIDSYPQYVNDDIYSGRGCAKRSVRNYKGAILDFSKCIEINPDNFFAIRERAHLKVHLKDWQEAINDFNAAIKLRPIDADLHYNKGKVYTDMGEYNLALESLTKAIEVDKNNPVYYSTRGYVKELLGLSLERDEDYNIAKVIQQSINNKEVWF